MTWHPSFIERTVRVSERLILASLELFTDAALLKLTHGNKSGAIVDTGSTPSRILLGGRDNLVLLVLADTLRDSLSTSLKGQRLLLECDFIESDVHNMDFSELIAQCRELFREAVNA